MRTQTLLICFAALILRNSSIAQSPDETHFNLMETLAESFEGDPVTNMDYESVLADLEFLYEHPLNLNTALVSDLQRLPFLTDFQIQSLMQYREEHGALLSLYELQVIHGYDSKTITNMMPYVMLDESERTAMPAVGSHLKYIHGEVTISSQRTLEKASGYGLAEDPAVAPYPGDPWRYYGKVALRSGDRISAGMTMEKDPGEQFLAGSNRHGFDYYSAHLMVQQVGPFKTIIAGDYRLQFGQGLTLWSGFSSGKSSLPLNVIKRQEVLRPYTSVEENNFFRGIAFSCVLGKFTVSGFFSSKNRDVNVTDTLESGALTFSSFLSSGYHRTADEIRDEKALRENALGSNITFRTKTTKVGITLASYAFDGNLEKSEKPYEAYDFYGGSLTNAGVDYAVTLNRIQFGGEVSYGNHSFATIHSAIFQAGKYGSLALVYRNYPASYFSLHSSAFSESSENSNEKGIYLGTELHPAAHWNISAYADFYHFPWLRYRVNAPSSGSDYLLNIGYNPNSSLEMFLRFRYEHDQVNRTSDSLPVDELVFADYFGIRYHLSYHCNDALLFRTRLEYVGVSNDAGQMDKGFMCYQDIQWHLRKVPLILYFRYAWFDTDNYGARIYAYEQQTLPSFTSVALYDEGYRTYIMLRYNVAEWLSCWMRMARTSYAEKLSIGSGNDEILSGSKHEIKLQLLIRF